MGHYEEGRVTYLMEMDDGERVDVSYYQRWLPDVWVTSLWSREYTLPDGSQITTIHATDYEAQTDGADEDDVVHHWWLCLSDGHWERIGDENDLGDYIESAMKKILMHKN